MRRCARPAIARLAGAALALCFSWPQPAAAIQVFDLGSESYIVPDWFIYSGSPAGGVVITQDGGTPTNFEVRVGATNFGASEDDVQTSAIYGAGALLPANDGAGYRIEFTTEVYGWDSYNDTVATEGGSGYWDFFSINLNETAYYWDQVDGGAGALTDPLIVPDPAGSCVLTAGGAGACQAATANPLGGETWAWGALDYGNGTFESNVGAYSLTLAGGTGPYFLSAVLDTATSPDADDSLPSFGAFNPLSAVPPPTVPEPGSIQLFGAALLGLGLRARSRRSA